jgi:hypothetical protein
MGLPLLLLLLPLQASPWMLAEHPASVPPSLLLLLPLLLWSPPLDHL